MNPAASVIQKFGGVRPLARLLNVSPSTVCRWQKPKPGGTGGMIQAQYHGTLLGLARRKKIALTADELVWR